MAITMGLLSALCWGAVDFLLGPASRQLGVTRLLFFNQFLGLVVLSAIVLVDRPEVHADSMGSGIALAVLAAICNLIALGSLMKAMSVGKASVVAPIVSLYGAVTTALSLLDDQTMTPVIAISLLLCVVGASLASIPQRSVGKAKSSATILALLSAVMFGLCYWLQGTFAVRYIGPVGTLWINYVCTVFLLLAALAWNRNMSLPSRSKSRPILTIGLLSMLGFCSLAFGVNTGHVAAATVLSSLAGAVTAVLGFTIRKERPTLPQCIGVSVIIVGVVALKLSASIT